MVLFDQLAAKRVDDPLLWFGGEGLSANLDPTVNTNVIGADPVTLQAFRHHASHPLRTEAHRPAT